MKKIFFYITFLFAVSFLVTSCEDDDYEAGDAGSVTLSGDWVVNEYDLDMNNLYGPYELQIYNTSYGTDSVWVDNIYDADIKVKAAKTSETSFVLSSGPDVAGGYANVSISEALVIDYDSIVFRVTLYNEDGSVYDDYYEAGTRYTGWEDE